MNTLLSWALPLFYFLTALAFTSVVGLGCYSAGRRINNRSPDTVLAIGFLLGVIDVCLVMAAPTVFVFTLIILAIGSVGTFVERAAHPADQNWGWGFTLLRMCLTMVCTVGLSLLLLFGIASRFPSIASELFTEFWFPLGATIGMFFSPSVIPVCIWLWQGSRLRPGIDRPLENNDVSS